MHWGVDHASWHLWPLHWLLCIVVLALIIAGLVRWLSFRGQQVPLYNSGRQPSQPPALEILHQRYARGEIDDITFEQMRERLESRERSKE